MRIAICDDEKEIRDMLLEKIQRFYPKAELSCYQSGEELLLAHSQPDILLLDIQMPGKNGISTAEELRMKWKTTILIFVTALEEYVYQAFDVEAFHYLVKPFSDEKFYEVLTKAVEKQKERNDRSKTEPERCIMVHSGGEHIKILLNDIVYAEVFNRKVMIHKRDEVIEYYGRLSELEKLLGEDFFRPHRAYVVHLKYVVKYNAASITMQNGTVLMAKANFQEFVRRYLKYNQRKGKETE